MADPFDALRAPVVPVDPDPAFAAGLRARLARAIADRADEKGGRTVADNQPTQELPDVELEEWPPAAAATPAAAGVTITPYLAVAGASAALDWYAEAFGATVRGEPIVMPDGRIGHAEMDFGGALLMLSDEYPDIGVAAPVAGQGMPVTLHLEVADVDGTIRRAVSAGARLERRAADYEYGRNGVIRDPFGHRWMVSGQPAAAPSAPAPPATGSASAGELREGDLGYVSLWVPDVARAARFFGGVLGWEYEPASGPQGRRVAGRDLHHGLWGDQERSTLFCCFAVADVSAAARRVVDAGGTAGAPDRQRYGTVVDCVDDQGVPFALYEPPGGLAAAGAAGGPGGAAGGVVAGPPPNGTRQGDLAYVTMEVVDADRALAFYGHVVGWRADPGQVPNGWQIRDVAPMVGVHGGHEVATTVPMYRVDDVAAAVQAVRDLGGTASDPERQPYGITSLCVDDQGTRFYLGQL